MSHYTVIYGYIHVYYKDHEDVERYLRTFRDEAATEVSRMIFGPFSQANSGFYVYSICGERKEFVFPDHEGFNRDPAGFIEEIRLFLDGLKGVYAVVRFEADLAPFPDKVEFAFRDGQWEQVA